MKQFKSFHGWVVGASDEFFLAMDAQEEPNFMAIIANPGWVKANETAKAVIWYIWNYLTETVFLNGPKELINCQVKNTAHLTWLDAIDNAIKVDSDMKWPINHTIAIEKSKSSTSVNFIKRSGSYGSVGANSGHIWGSSSLLSRQPSASKPRTNLEYWYNRKLGHAQKFCRIWIFHGTEKAQVWGQITDDNINYQDGSDDKAAAEDHDDQDNYLTNAINRDQNVGSINIIAVHLD